MSNWNPWHGCTKISEGCKNCYVYRMDARYERDASVLKKTLSFDLPVRKDRLGNYKLKGPEVVYTCFSSDFFHKDADELRVRAWEMIKQRSELDFLMITKRIDRFNVSLPADWGGGYDNVTVCCTAENQQMADYRLPIYLSLPIKRKSIICEPLLGEMNIRDYLTPDIAQVVAGGESGENARVCDYDWILSLREQCIKANVAFHFKQTGAYFRKDGKVYKIKRALQHIQARKADINFVTNSSIMR